MKRKKRGMTLVEVIAAMTIFSIMSVAILSVITMSVKVNSNNRVKFQSSANSRMFIETLKVKANKPEKYVAAAGATPKKGITPGNYYIGFDTDSEVSNLAKNLSTTIPTNNTAIPTLSDVRSSGVITSGDKYAMAIKVEWQDSVGLEKIYIIDIWSWDLVKEELSEVKRRVLIAPK